MTDLSPGPDESEQAHCRDKAREWVHANLMSWSEWTYELTALIARERAAARETALEDGADAIREALWPTTVGGEYARKCANIVAALKSPVVE